MLDKAVGAAFCASAAILASVLAGGDGLCENAGTSAAAEPAERARIEALVAELGSHSWRDRAAAEEGLFKAGAGAAAALEACASGKPQSPAALRARRLIGLFRWRIHPARADLELLMEGFGDRPLLSRMAAIFELEKLCDAPAMDVLEAIAAGDASARVRAYAAAAMRRAGFRLGGGRGDVLAVLNSKGCAHLGKGEYADALAMFDEMLRISPGNSTALYNKACAYSRMKEADRAFEFLKKAIDVGFADRDHIAADRDFDNIRDDPRFKEILDALARE